MCNWFAPLTILSDREFMGLSNNFTKINFTCFRNPKQGVQSGVSQISFNKTHNRMRKPRTLSEYIHGKATLFSCLSQQADYS